MKIIKNEPLSKHTTFGIGGPAHFFSYATSVEECAELFRWAQNQNLPFVTIGNGSNILFDDRGFCGLVIKNLLNKKIDLGDGFFQVESGFSFSRLGTQTAKLGYTGLEFAAGIPATVGGAIYMNAGASGQETIDTLKTVTFLHSTGEIEKITTKKETFSYRTSPFQSLQGTILEGLFQLNLAKDVRKAQIDQITYRKKTQPYKSPSAGCSFRNPEGNCAGALIEKAGLKGKSTGGAEVSTLHANFIINKGGATAQDVLNLITYIQETIHNKFQITLEKEVIYIPYDPLAR